MGFICLPALFPDTRNVYDAYFEAFKGEPILDILYPGGVDDKFRDLHTQALSEHIKQCQAQYTIKCIDTDTGKVAGMGLWEVYLRERSEEELPKPGVDWLEGSEKERALKILSPLWEKKRAIMGGKPHIYCHLIAVKPEYQRRGVGKLLTQWGLDLAEQSQLPVYLESSPQGRKLYRDLGFEEIDAVIHQASCLGTEKDVEIPLMIKVSSG